MTDYKSWWRQLKPMSDDAAECVLKVHDDSTYNKAIEESAIRAVGKAVMEGVADVTCKEIADVIMELRR